MKKLLSILLVILMVIAMTGCGEKRAKFVVGICQYVQDEPLDNATQGFIDALKEEMGDEVTFINNNGSGEPGNCSVICNDFVTDKVDLIMANATPALQTAVSATGSIPILGTSVTNYESALKITLKDGATGTNVSGTTDLADLNAQGQMIIDLIPDVKKVGIIYCSSEANSIFQADAVEAFLKGKGIEVNRFTFVNSADLAEVVGSACASSDAIYAPTDNALAAASETVNAICMQYKKPVIAGEEGLCKGCGVATLTISYYDLGFATGKMAARILRGEAKVSEMPIEFCPTSTYKFVAERCAALGISVPSDYVEIK